MSERFHITDILGVVTKKLLGPRKLQGISAVLCYMTHDNLCIHQLPRARDECAPWLLRQYPRLATLDASHVTPDNREQWLSQAYEQLGPDFTDAQGMLSIEPIPQDDHERIDPYDELVIMRGTDEGVILMALSVDRDDEIS